MNEYLEGGGDKTKMGSAEQFSHEFGQVPQVRIDFRCSGGLILSPS